MYIATLMSLEEKNTATEIMLRYYPSLLVVSKPKYNF